jgi:hypothetical protein
VTIPIDEATVDRLLAQVRASQRQASNGKVVDHSDEIEAMATHLSELAHTLTALDDRLREAIANRLLRIDTLEDAVEVSTFGSPHREFLTRDGRHLVARKDGTLAPLSEAAEDEEEDGGIVVTPLDPPAPSYPRDPGAGVWYGYGWPTPWIRPDARVVRAATMSPEPAVETTSCIFCGRQIRKIHGKACLECVPSQGEVRPGVIYWWNEESAKERWIEMLKERRARITQLSRESKREEPVFAPLRDWIDTVWR